VCDLFQLVAVVSGDSSPPVSDKLKHIAHSLLAPQNARTVFVESPANVPGYHDWGGAGRSPDSQTVLQLLGEHIPAENEHRAVHGYVVAVMQKPLRCPVATSMPLKRRLLAPQLMAVLRSSNSQPANWQKAWGV